MGCDIWIDQTLQDGVGGLSATKWLRLGQKITISSKTICRVGFYLKKAGSPSGTITATIRKTSDDGIIETSGDTLDISTLTTTFAWKYFTFNSLVNEEVRLQVEYSGGDNSHYGIVGDYVASDVITGNLGGYKAAGYTDWVDFDCTIKIYETITIKPGGSIVQIVKAIGLI